MGISIAPAMKYFVAITMSDSRAENPLFAKKRRAANFTVEELMVILQEVAQSKAS